jgi:hypothetical protein
MPRERPAPPGRIAPLRIGPLLVAPPLLAPLLLALALCLAACVAPPRPAGRNFTQSLFARFVLNQTSVEEVVASLGAPMTRSTLKGLSNGKSRLVPLGTPFSLTILVYYFAPNGFGQPPDQHPAKAASAVFFDGRLVAYATDSAIPGDTNAPIDEAKLAALRQGETTRDQAIALLGPPNGALLHLLDSQHGASEISYTWLNMDGPTIRRRTLRVLFDGAGQLTDYTLLDTATPAGAEPIPLPRPEPPEQFTPGAPAAPDLEHT